MSMVSGLIGGVDTHADVHVAAAIDGNGGVLGVESFPASTAGYEHLTCWLTSFGPVVKVGIEGRDRMASACPDTSTPTVSRSWRWIGRTGRSGAGWGIRIRSTPKPQREPPCQVRRR